MTLHMAADTEDRWKGLKLEWHQHQDLGKTEHQDLTLTYLP